MRRRSQSSELAVAVAPPRVPAVARVLYTPVKLVSGRIAPRIASRLYARLWGVIDGGAPPPRADDREVSVTKLALALGLEGACAAAVRGVIDQLSRRQFARLTGRWPGRKAKS